jgi:hypothetical protein
MSIRVSSGAIRFKGNDANEAFKVFSEQAVPADCSGRWSECKRRNPELTLRKWYRAQMRGWARHWRQRRIHAAILGKPAEQLGQTALNFARMYRDAAALGVKLDEKEADHAA